MALADPSNGAMLNSRPRLCWWFAPLLLMAPAHLRAQTALSGEQISIARANGAIVIDGLVDDPGWQGATRVEKWYETSPGDNVEPPNRNLGYVAYDDEFIY